MARSNGQGVLTQPNGDVYTGVLVDGQRQGEGRVVYDNGDVYEGDFLDDRRHGNGVFTRRGRLCLCRRVERGPDRGAGTSDLSATGSVYVGSFRDDLAHGRGTNHLSRRLLPTRATGSTA